MQFGVMHFFADGTKDNYEASIAAVHPGPGRLPAGQIFHMAAPTAGGWTIVAVHDSKESWVAFRDGKLISTMQKGIAGGFANPPQETELPLYKFMTA